MNGDNITINSQILFRCYMNFFDKNISNIPMQHEYQTKDYLVYQYLKDIPVMNNYTIEDVKEVSMIYDFIIGKEREKLELFLSKFNYNEILISFYYLAEYIAEFHHELYTRIYNVNGKFYGSYSGDLAEFKDEYKNYVVNKIIDSKFDFNLISSYMGRDKAFIQYFFMFLDNNKKNYGKGHIIKEEDFYDIYFNIFNIILLVSERNMLINIFYKFKKIIVKKYCIILPDEFHHDADKVIHESFENSIEIDNSVAEELYNELDKNFEKQYGFSHKDLVLFLNSSITDISEMIKMYYKEDLLKETIKVIGDINKSKKIINFLTFQNQLEKQEVESIAYYGKRVLITPIIETNIDKKEVCILSYYLLYHAVHKIFENIIFNNFEVKIKDNKEIIKDKNNKIVYDIHKYIVNRCDFAKCNFNIKDKENNKEYEVDIIFVVNCVLYIVECKDVCFKFDTYGFKGQIRQGKKYIKNINIKEKIIKNNISKG